MENLAMNSRAFAYLRTSSQTNIGEHKDSDKRQRAAIEAYAARDGIEIVGWFYDAAVKGSDPIQIRPGFADMLARIAGNGVRMILVETANRFARDLVVQETGFSYLRGLGISLVPVDAPNYFSGDDDPMRKAIRQILGVIAELDKSMTVAKLKAARDRMSRDAGHRIEGRKGYSVTSPELIREAKRLARRSPKTGKARSLRTIAAELAAAGFTTAAGKTFSASQVQRLISGLR
jgi:DNA invertase Pin-like site-specific DNA recombinase